MAKSGALSKAGLVSRVALHLSQYGIDPGDQTPGEWTRKHINEWLSNSLALAGEPGPNEGRKRSYLYSCRHYRRALQLVRLYGNGRTVTADLHVQLFIRGYSGVSQDLKDAVLSEYQKFRAQLIAPMRSKEFTKTGPVSTTKQQQINKRLGTLDDRLHELALPTDLYLDVARLAREQDPDARDHRQSFSQPELFEFLRPIFAGMLDEGDASEAETETERLIHRSDRAGYERARLFLTFIFAQTKDASPTDEIGALRIALRQREFTAFLVVFALRLGPAPI
jgi:hypothetical protein